MGLWIQNFKQALRGLRHQGWQAVVSVAGLAVSIVCLTFSVNWLWTETHYDSFRPDYEGLYVLERGDTLWRSPYVWYDLGVELDSVLGENVSVGIYRPQRGRELFCLPDRPETAFYAQGLAASRDMVTTFGCRVLSGSLEDVAAANNQFILTESMARRLFGRIDVVGEGICRVQGGEQSLYTVGAVVEDCRGKSNLYYDFIRPWWVGDYERNNVNYGNFHILLRTSHLEQTERELSRIDPEEKRFHRKTGADSFTYVS